MDEHGIAVGTTQRGGPFYLDMLRRTSDVTNSNFGIIGAAGQGKSTLMKKLIEFLTMMGVSCFTLDPENEYGELFRNLGGTVYKCVDGRSVINPLEVRWLYREDEDAQDEEDTLSKELQNMSMFFQHLSWLKDFFRILFPGISDLDTQALMVLVQEMYAAHGVNTETDFSKFTPADYPTLSDLYQYIEHYDTEKSRISSTGRDRPAPSPPEGVLRRPTEPDFQRTHQRKKCEHDLLRGCRADGGQQGSHPGRPLQHLHLDMDSGNETGSKNRI